MNARRYNAYRAVSAELEVLMPDALADDEKELLRDAAEGLLLARDAESDSVDELRGRVAVALSVLVDTGRWSEAAADEIWESLVACGPAERAAAPAHAV